MTEKRKRRWLQFSLASLLLVMTVLGLSLGLWTDSARRQEQAAEALRQKGWRILYHHEMESPGKPVPPGPAWVREWLGIDYVDHVELVGFEGESITDADLATLSEFPRLTIVVIRDAPNVTDAGLAHLASLHDLKDLVLECLQITDAGLVHVAKLQGLEKIKLRSDRITDAGLAHVVGLPRLWYVSLASNQITDAGVALLKKLPGLYSVQLESDNITDAGLVHLRALPKLDSLGLDCSVTDAGMQHLTVLKNLEHLFCRGPPADKPRRELVAVVNQPSGFDHWLPPHHEEWTLGDVCFYLDDFHVIAARLDEEALAAAHIDPTTQFSSDLANLPAARLSLFLDALLHPHELGWYIGDGELVITTAAIDNEKHAGINRLRAALPKLKRLKYSW